MLYNAAKIDENNVVVDVIVVAETDISDENGISDELTTAFANQVRQTTGTWKAAGMYQEGTGEWRGVAPSIGDNWAPDSDRFYIEQPWPSWTLDSDFNWNPPVPKPNDITQWRWQESTQSWELPLTGEEE